MTGGWAQMIRSSGLHPFTPQWQKQSARKLIAQARQARGWESRNELHGWSPRSVSWASPTRPGRPALVWGSMHKPLQTHTRTTSLVIALIMGAMVLAAPLKTWRIITMAMTREWGKLCFPKNKTIFHIFFASLTVFVLKYAEFPLFFVLNPHLLLCKIFRTNMESEKGESERCGRFLSSDQVWAAL